MNETIETLRAERDYWKAEALGQVTLDQQVELRTRFNLTRSEGWLLSTLYGLRGKTLTRERLIDELPGGDHACVGDDRLRTAHVFILRIRKKLGAGVIETIRSVGYRITPEGIALIEGSPAC